MILVGLADYGRSCEHVARTMPVRADGEQIGQVIHLGREFWPHLPTIHVRFRQPCTQIRPRIECTRRFAERLGKSFSHMTLKQNDRLRKGRRMAAFLLWNTGRKNLDGLVQNLVREHKIDIVLLVEYYPSKVGSTLSTLLLNHGLVRRSVSERFGVFSRPIYGMRSVGVTGLGDRVGLWDWIPNPNSEARFALVHGLDRIHNDDGTRRVFFRRVADAVRAHEANSHRRSMIVGDFNAHPFESAILSSDGLHAIGIRQVGTATCRRVRWGDEEENFFYNPMWRKYGHVTSREAGMATHYWQNNQAGELFWHMLDQVVIRPEESRSFPEDKLTIVSSVGTATLLAPDGRPDDTVGSDHLPVVFHWDVQ